MFDFRVRVRVAASHAACRLACNLLPRVLIGLWASALAPAALQAANAAIVPAATDASTTDAVASQPEAGRVAVADQAGAGGAVQTVVVTAQRLNAARAEIEVQTGASTYTIDSAAIAAAPGGVNVQMNQVLLQAPDVVQDSFGQLHVRGDHNDLQYRLNGVILPEGISVFSQTLSPRLVSSLSLITGALPAEYGLRTAGIIDLSTNSGLLQPGGEVSIYGGSHDTIHPAAEYGGSSGNFSYYLTGDVLHTGLGIESPDGSSNPLHDDSTQAHLFSFLEHIVDEHNRISLILGLSDDSFEIPNQRGLQPTMGLNVNGQTMFLSDNLDENQHELAEYAILTWQHSAGALNWESSVSARYTSLHYLPDWTGDLLYNGIAQDAFKDDTAVAWQTDGSYKLSDAHTVRAGFYLQHDWATNNSTSQVLCLGADAPPTCFATTPVTVPQTIIDNSSQTQAIESVYLQDEWRIFSGFTLNYGVRFDHYTGYSSGSQTSPRVNFVWQLPHNTTIHGGYSSYFTPPPFELIASQSLNKYYGTSALPPGSNTENSPPIAESANYYDFGVQQKLFESLTLGVDSYLEQARHLIDEGQFGAPIILTPFNYRYGHIAGIEFTENYTVSNFSVYANLAFQTAKGKQVESAQFNFAQDDLNYIANNYIHLDHEGRVSASGGVSYLWGGTRASADMIFGTGLRQDLVLADGSTVPNGDHTPSYTQVNLGLTHAFRIGGTSPLTLRFDVINLFDKVYQIRSGSGVGVFAPQYGPRRGFFAGLSYAF